MKNFHFAHTLGVLMAVAAVGGASNWAPVNAGSYGTSASAAVAAAVHTNKVWIKDYRFSPAAIVVSVGTKVTWTNAGFAVHTVTSKLGPRPFDSGDLAHGQRYAHTFWKPGTYNYYCRHHPSMKGKLVVRMPSATSASPRYHPAPPAYTPPAPPSTANPATTRAPALATQVTIKDFAFMPATLTIRAGTTVTWTNQDTAAHTATATGVFDSGNLNRSQSYSRTFAQPGTYNYICTYHPYMKGTIIVTP